MKNQKIYGLRMYMNSIAVDNDGKYQIFFHDRIDKTQSDFSYIFSPLESAYKELFLSDDFGVTVGEDPRPSLEEDYGKSLIDLDLKSQLIVLDFNLFSEWKNLMRPIGGAIYTVFSEKPSFEYLNQFYWGHRFKLSGKTWDKNMRAVINMWDDVLWQIFSTNEEDIRTLVRAHINNKALKLFEVNYRTEYPTPTGKEIPIDIEKYVLKE